VATLAQGGQILLTQEVFEKVKAHAGVGKKGEFIEMGKMRTKDLSDDEHEDADVLHEFKPNAYPARTFGNTYHKRGEKILTAFILTPTLGAVKGKKGKEGNQSESDSEEDSLMDNDAIPQLVLFPYLVYFFSRNIDPFLVIIREDSFLTSANMCRWVISSRQLEMKEKLGAGSLGTVYKAEWKGVTVAVKVRNSLSLSLLSCYLFLLRMFYLLLFF